MFAAKLKLIMLEYKLTDTVTASFNTTVRQMTKMSQRKKQIGTQAAWGSLPNNWYRTLIWRLVEVSARDDVRKRYWWIYS